MKEVQKTSSKQVSAVGEEILSDLRAAWCNVELEREVVALIDGQPGFTTKTVVVPSPVKRLNQHVQPEAFARFAAMVSPEDAPRIKAVIQSGNFEVEKAIHAFQVGPKVVIDKSIRPTTWEEAEALNAPSLATLIKYKGKEKTVDLIYTLLFGFAQKFGRRNDMGEELIRELSEDIADQFRSLTVADLKVILHQSMNVKKLFNLDYQTIFNLVAEKFGDKLEAAAERYISKHSQIYQGPPREAEQPPVLSLAEQVAEVKLRARVFDGK